jgi:chromosome condensin MukBEF ATPase and DNA-binding subunit MukB
VDQGRRHVDELRAQIDIHLARLLHVSEVLRRDGGDGDVLDVDLLLADQVQQQVQRPLILLQMDIQRRRHRFHDSMGRTAHERGGCGSGKTRRRLAGNAKKLGNGSNWRKLGV